MKMILGKKLDMTQVWQGDQVVAVTRVQAGPCTVVQVKNKEKDKYEAVQLGYGERKKKNINKPQQGHMKGLDNFRYLREFLISDDKNVPGLKRGDKIDVSTFASGDEIQVTGISKGKGFQGVVRRYGFKGTKATHGNKDQLRMPGSIGATGPAHVFKGQKMPGRMGGDQSTIKNLEIVEVNIEKNELLIKGAVPGARNGLILISGEGDLVVSEVKSEKVESNNKPKDDENPKEAEIKESEKAEIKKIDDKDKKEIDKK